ncbi:hypothetical protein BU14_0159s0019 [Porphyra umbilicalis]|uniref:NADH dehydrogenase [ubiquinone] 1 alpha subcomplex subunit 13 n=1 Tax=Porphyra umbilicalis TaxID=2786 RepID=A0A1X6P8W0_PORUM|nr:hypothetical protein BU14_0159s0019 [Porphyra umbilicalis]|eukprot:OSX77165.1 hypothetical protein BU14_0159s0019 [Porphyra umbilicalis]
MAPQATPPRPPPRVGVQDMAPPGGYASIGVARNVPKSVGPRASLLMLAGALVMGGGCTASATSTCTGGSSRRSAPPCAVR